MSIGDRIKNRRKEIGMSAETLGEKIGKAKTTIYRYESGDIMKVPSTILESIAQALNVTPAYLMGWDDAKLHKGILPVVHTKIRLLGSVACGEPIFADEEFDSYVEAGSDIKADFCVRASGDSMIGARINDGDIVFVREQSMVNNGEIAVVIINDTVTLKRVYYYKNANKLVLQSENPKYEPFVYVGEELNEIKILGKAVAFQSNL